MTAELLGTVRIYAQDGSRLEDECAGPSWFGGCPRSSSSGVVACAGRRIEVTTRTGRQIVLEVEADAVSCPLIFLAFAGGAASEPSEA